MSEPKHTPGPWNLQHCDTGWTVGPNAQRRGDHVADVHEHQSGAMSDATAAANASLIAAAPDLLAACEAAIKATGGSEHWQGETRAFLLLAEAAVAKAKGETA